MVSKWCQKAPVTKSGLSPFCRFRIDKRKWESDRRGSNPPPSEPQSADTCYCRLPIVAGIAYLSRFPCSRLPGASACCVLSGVRSGVSAPINLPYSWTRRAAEARGAEVSGARLARRRTLPTTTPRKRPRSHQSLISTPEVWSAITPISYEGIRITCRKGAIRSTTRSLRIRVW